MKTIGLLGGMSWESTALYYRLINEGVRDRLGGLHSARMIISSVDFAEIERLQSAGAWAEAGAVLGAEALKLEDAGADFIVLCTNTMHKVAGEIESAVTVPLLHLADVTAQAVNAAGAGTAGVGTAGVGTAGVGTVGLLGTAFTMEQAFYRDRLERHGLTVIVPTESERAIVRRVIFDELVQGVVADESRRLYIEIIHSLRARGATGVILGCTEIELLIDQAGSPLPVFKTTELHVQAALDTALAT